MNLAGADPVNRVGVLIPGEGVAAALGRTFILYTDSFEQTELTVTRGLRARKRVSHRSWSLGRKFLRASFIAR